jgi:predicted RNA-binding Zn-ribbon protein involved in translation (DUF1610 family)
VSWQLECLQCGFTLPPRTAAHPACPNCGAGLHIISDTEPRYQRREDYEHAKRYTAQQCKCGLHQ